MFMIVTIVVDDVHFLVHFLVFLENLDRGRFGRVLDHLVIDGIDVAS